MNKSYDLDHTLLSKCTPHVWVFIVRARLLLLQNFVLENSKEMLEIILKNLNE
jgi:hypothetical protein